MRGFIITLILLNLSLASQAQEEDRKRYSRPDLPGIFLIDIGLNIFNDAPGGMEIGSFGSKTTNLYYFYPIRIGQSGFTFNPGIGLGLEKFKFEDANTLQVSSGLTTIVPINNLFPGADVKKSKLTANYLDIPIEFRWHARKYDMKRSFKVAAGGKVGYLYGSHTKIKYSLDGEDIKLKNKQRFNLNQFRYGIYGRVGIGGVNLFFYYALNELFESGKGPFDTHVSTMSTGISITGF